MTKLHFKVCGEGIMKLARDIYLYEEDKERAFNILGSLGGITYDQIKAVLIGDAKLITLKDGDEVGLVFEKDTSFKKEREQHLSFLKRESQKKKEKIEEKRVIETPEDYDEDMTDDQRALIKRAEEILKIANPDSMRYKTAKAILKEDKEDIREAKLDLANQMLGPNVVDIRNRKIASKRMDKCAVDDCPYNHKGRCTFSKIELWGCYQEYQEVRERMTEVMIYARNPADGALAFTKSMGEKVFKFKHEGEEYTIKDSARIQSQCPHCNTQCQDGNMYRPSDKGFVGYKSFGKKPSILGDEEDSYAACFKCPNCGGKFFYHTTMRLDKDD